VLDVRGIHRSLKTRSSEGVDRWFSPRTQTASFASGIIKEAAVSQFTLLKKCLKQTITTVTFLFPKHYGKELFKSQQFEKRKWFDLTQFIR
jgi:hypothetical protein